MYKYCLIFFLLIISCKEKNSFKEISINENILKEIKEDTDISKGSWCVYNFSIYR